MWFPIGNISMELVLDQNKGAYSVVPNWEHKFFFFASTSEFACYYRIRFLKPD